MYCNLDKIDLYYEDIGEGIPIIMLHGLEIDHNMMKGCMEPIFQPMDGYRRIYIDLPGMGKTKGEEWSANADTMLRILLEFIDKIIPQQNFMIAAYSYGAYIARAILKLRMEKVAGMMLICPVTVMDRAKRKLPERPVLYEDKELMESLSDKEKRYFNMVERTRNNWDRYKKEVVPSFKLFDREYIRNFRGKGYRLSFDVEDVIFDKPVTIITGRFDDIVGYKDSWNILDKYPRATYTVLDMGSHNLQIEQRDLFDALVLNWISRIEKY